MSGSKIKRIDAGALKAQLHDGGELALLDRFAISRPLLNLKGDQTTIDQTSDIPQAGRRRIEARSLNSIERLQKQM